MIVMKFHKFLLHIAVILVSDLLTDVNLYACWSLFNPVKPGLNGEDEWRVYSHSFLVTTEYRFDSLYWN